MAGILIALMTVIAIVSDISEQTIPIVTAGIFGWCAVFFLFTQLKTSQRWQTGLLTIIGIALILISAQRFDTALWARALGNNAALLGMLASVGLLRLITLSDSEDSAAALPTGFASFVKTMAGVSLFGSVINLSAPILFADRLYKHNVLSRLASQSITRIFTSTSCWSPFFGGMAAVLTYVPDMRLGFVILVCFPFAVVSFIVVVCEARFRYSEQVNKFSGYPVNFFNLWIPAALAVIILVLSHFVPDWSVLTRISLSAMLLTTVVLLYRSGVQSTGKMLSQYVVDGLPRMANELQLFLAAGVLAAGISSVIAGGELPWLLRFGAMEACLLLAFMILLAVAGVHPVVTITGATPLVMTLQPAPDLLAVCYLLAWGLGTSASPLSGTHLVFQGRYGIPSWKGAFWNWPYTAFMYLVAAGLLGLVSVLAGVNNRP